MDVYILIGVIICILSGFGYIIYKSIQEFNSEWMRWSATSSFDYYINNKNSTGLYIIYIKKNNNYVVFDDTTSPTEITIFNTREEINQKYNLPKIK